MAERDFSSSWPAARRALNVPFGSVVRWPAARETINALVEKPSIQLTFCAVQSVDGAPAVAVGIAITPSRGARKGHFESKMTWLPTAPDRLGPVWWRKSWTQRQLFSTSRAIARYVQKGSDHLREHVRYKDEQQLMHDSLCKRLVLEETRARS